MTTRRIILDGGSPWGFRVHGGADVQQPLKISRVNPGSKAAVKGIREADIVTSINGRSTRNTTNAEAHALLKSSGDTLCLGLNEDLAGSPKRRQVKTVHQEEHAETFNKSTVSSSKYSKTSTSIECSDKSPTIDEEEPTKTKTNINGLSHATPSSEKRDQAESAKSTLSSNYSSNPSELSYETESNEVPGNKDTGVAKSDLDRPLRDTTTHISPAYLRDMSDNGQVSARSQRKPNRRNSKHRRRKCKRNSVPCNYLEETEASSGENTAGNTIESDAVNTETAEEIQDTLGTIRARQDEKSEVQNYRVDSPTRTTKKLKSPVKSKSLDDDESLKITELSDVSESEEKTASECSAVVSEVESDVEWERTANLVTEEKGKLESRKPSECALNLNECAITEMTSHISPEEEVNLRKFLEGLQLPGISESKIEKIAAENFKDKKAKKREALAQYFIPAYQNPRYLDVIKEENSDVSDKERDTKDSAKFLQKDSDAKVYKSIVEHVTKMQQRMIPEQIPPPEAEDYCSTIVTPSSCGAEIVFIPDSSSNSEGDVSEEEESNEGTQESENQVEDRVLQISPEITQKIEEHKPENVDIQPIRSNDTPFTTNEDILLSQLTPPPTPDSASPKNEKNSTNVSETTSASETIIADLTMEGKEKKFDVTADIAEDKLSQPNIDLPIFNSSRSPSVSSNESSSRGTSLCTVRYNPLLNEDDFGKFIRPSTLREICLNYLFKLPFGKDVLQELAEVSMSLENFTHSLMHPFNKFKLVSSLITNSSSTNSSCILPVKSPIMSKEQEWVGLHSEKDPKVLLCLSPKQKDYLDKTKPVSNEAEKLLELHEKFLSRKGYTDSTNTDHNSNVKIIKIDFEDNKSEPRNYDESYLYYEEKNKPLSLYTTASVTLPRMDKNPAELPRLKARNLSEWLQLARGKCVSESNLSEPTGIVTGNRYAAPDFRRTHDSARGRYENNFYSSNRRSSLPNDIFERQLRHIMEKEQEIQRELEHLEEEKRKLAAEMNAAPLRTFVPDDYCISRKGDIAIYNEHNKKMRPTSLPVVTEYFRQQMYEEYMKQVEARQERKQNKVIKISMHPVAQSETQEANSIIEAVHVPDIEDEFMDKVKKRKTKLGIQSEERDNSRSETETADDESDQVEELVLLLDGESITGTSNLPKHLQEFVYITRKAAEDVDSDGVWSPAQKRSPPRDFTRTFERQNSKDDAVPPVWTPRSAGSSPTADRKEFRPVNFESPVLSRKNKPRFESQSSTDSIEPPWKAPESSSDTGIALSSTLEKRIPNSYSAPAFADFPTSRLPRAQNPTITLLQKAREGQLPRGAAYINQETYPARRNNERPPLVAPGDPFYEIKNEYTKVNGESPRRMVELGPRKYEGIGPTTKDGMPIILKSEVREPNQSKWYKRMYDTIHKQKPHNDEYVTVRYKQRRARNPYLTGYLSEPEPGAYDSDATMSDKYATLDRRRPPREEADFSFNSYTMPKFPTTVKYWPTPSPIRYDKELTQNQPGKIENYIPGHSSISDKEAKEWWDEIMDIFDGWLDDQTPNSCYNYILSRAMARRHLDQQKHIPPQNRGYMSQALKESGYESDSTLIFRRRDDTAHQLSPQEQKEVYKAIQKGGDVPLHGLRKPAPEKPKASPQMEYFPISPTLTRIRIHKNIKPQKEIICYPLSVPPHPENVFKKYKRTAPSTVNVPKPPPVPPLPPKRKSSRNNSTLRLISTMKVKSDRSKRHETCFSTTSIADKNKIKYLRDKITCKLSPGQKKKNGSIPRIKVTKVVSASPSLKSRITSTLTTDESKSKVKSKTNISNLGSTTNPCSTTKSTRSTKKFTNSPKKPLIKSESDAKSNSRTFGTEKRKVDLVLPKPTSKERLIKSPDLVSPTEVKKAVIKSTKFPPTYKYTTSVVSSVKNGIKTGSKDKLIPIKAGITEQGKEILKASYASLPNTPVAVRSRSASSSPTIATKPKSADTRSVSPKTVTYHKTIRPEELKKFIYLTKDRDFEMKTKKHKKDQLNGEIVKRTSKLSKTKQHKTFANVKKCAGRAAGTDILKKLRQMEEDEKQVSLQASDMQKQADLLHSNSFFQHLLLRDYDVIPIASRNTWIEDKAIQLQRKRSPFSEPSIRAARFYLNLTKPVTDSKFRSLDVASIRSRSASPRSDKTSTSEQRQQTYQKRSTSLPPKLELTGRRKDISPVVSRKVIRSPSSIKSLKRPERNVIEFIKCPDQNLILTCVQSYPSSTLTQSATSIESLDQDDFHCKQLLYIPTKSERFKELSRFYSTLERFGELERTTSTTDLRPRRSTENEIIDYDRWKEVRSRERAEQELEKLYRQLKLKQKESGFLFRPKEVEQYRWKREFDRGLRIKDKTVENIKHDFENLKSQKAEINSRKRLEYAKDLYKPLWRGSSVLNLASSLTQRRSLSEGRAPISRPNYLDTEELLTRRIGSRIWSSLSLEQVNTLKNQLSEIYSQDSFKRISPPKYSVTYPSDDKRVSPSTTLTIRRNSDSTEFSYDHTSKTRAITSGPGISVAIMSENDKKRLSHSLSKEVLDRLSKGQKKPSHSLVHGKETRGAIAAAGANLEIKHIRGRESPRTCYSLEMSDDQETEKKQPDGEFVLVLTRNDTKRKHVDDTLQEWAKPKKALVTSDVTSPGKISSTSETESGSTDDSTRTVVHVDKKEDIQKKVEYFEDIAKTQVYTPTIYKPAETHNDIDELHSQISDKDISTSTGKLSSENSSSYQNLKELFGEREIVKFATVPLSASRKHVYVSPPRPVLRTYGSFLQKEADRHSRDSIYRSRSLSPYFGESYSMLRYGEVRKLRNQFEFTGQKLLRRFKSDEQLNRKSEISIPGQNVGDVDMLRRKYEYPAIAGRGRSRLRRGGVVSPAFLRAEDRFMPHINIISKIANLCSKKHQNLDYEKYKDKSIEELAQLLGCPVGEVEKMRQKFDSSDDISLLGHMFTSSPNLHELRDIAPYLAAEWIAHKYPRSEDNTRSLSSPEQSTSSRDLSLVRRHPRPKSASPTRPKRPHISSILKIQDRDSSKQKYDPTVHYPVGRYQPPPPKLEPVKFRSWWPPTPTRSRPTVSFKEPEAPPPPPKGYHGPKLPETESPRKYVENEVTIHYRTPIRQEVKESLSEEELSRRQAEAMKKIYEEERRRKYLQELQDMNSRRHTDNFIASQKSPISLNRYDDFVDDLSPKIKPRPRSPEARLVAKALYNFVGQSAKELTFRKGDIIYVKRQVDKNWYEGEHNAMVGLFPFNYVEIVPYDGIKTTPRKPHEGQARARYNFIAQTHLELSLAKGELVVITRRVDDNWFEGKIGGRKGIFPVSYVDVLIDPSEPPPTFASTKPVASPAAHSLLLNGSAGGKESMGSHSYTPSYSSPQISSTYQAKPVQVVGGSTYGSVTKNPVSQELHVDTHTEAVPYRALYKYRPQNDDELELLEGDTVYVLEKCDDGWYVGSSERTGAFGTFPGNYVERI